MIPELQTERLLLRAPRVGDFEPFAGFMDSERAEHERGRHERHMAWLHFAAAAGQWVLRGYGCFSVTDRASGAYLGEVGIVQEDDYPEPELGWMVVPEAEGRGIAREAALAVRGWAYREKGLGPLVSYIDPGNARSIRLAERLGAVREPGAPSPDPGDLVFRHPAPGAAQ